MNKVFVKYNFPESSPKKILVPLVSDKDTKSKSSFQLKLDLREEDAKDQGS